MKKIILGIIIIVLLVGCSYIKQEEKKEIEKPQEQEETPFVPIKDVIDKKVKETMENMTLEDKIGQMLIIAYRSNYDNTLDKRLKAVKPGGFILFSENITTYNNTINFVKKIKATSQIPMFISIDQEGGNVQRLQSLQRTKASYIPYMQQLGNTKNQDLSKEVGKVIAEELRVFGINMDFAPVLDVYSNPNNTVIGKRSFGTTADLVSKMGISLAFGLEENGVIPVYKHFPGHGNTAVDSHVALPIVTKSKSELYKLDLLPFRDAIANHAKVIMIGHLAVPSITKDNTPASLSKELITNFLKGELGYQGLVVTDGLEMNALTQNYSEEEIYVKAVEAGVDLLLIPPSPEKAVSSIKNAVKSGRIKEEVINESVSKILRLKYGMIDSNYQEYLPKEYLNSKEHQQVLSKIK